MQTHIHVYTSWFAGLGFLQYCRARNHCYEVLEQIERVAFNLLKFTDGLLVPMVRNLRRAITTMFTVNLQSPIWQRLLLPAHSSGTEANSLTLCASFFLMVQGQNF